MDVAGLFRPRPALTDEERAGGLRTTTWQAVSASAADGFASGGFLVAFALAMGANNTQIGIMTALPFLMQPLQVLALVVVERTGLRKAFAVSAYFVAYGAWVLVAMVPFVLSVPHAGAVTILLALVAVRGAALAFVTTGWNSWLQDLVPRESLGAFFALRLRMATLAAAVSSMAAAAYIDFWKGSVAADEVIYGYSIAILFGAVLLGWPAVGFMARIPEPRMARPDGPRRSLRDTLAAPFSDAGYRPLINFMFLWNFAAQLALPFFAVYMLERLDMPLSLVVGLTVASQLANVVFLRVWGPMVDQYGSKVVLSVSTSLFFLVVLGWTFTTLPDRHALTVPLLVVLHLLIGVATAGVNISTTTIRMKMAPKAQATSYLTAATLAASIGAGTSPLLGGLFADFFSVRHLQVAFEWVSPARTIEFPAVFLTGFDFLFAVAFLMGLVTLRVLATIREEGEVDQQVVMDTLMAQTRDNLRVLNTVPGLAMASRVPEATVRFVPRFAGLDVAAGVTAYQAAASMRDAVVAVSTGRRAARSVSRVISRAVLQAARQAGDLGAHGAGLAVGATSGAVHAALDSGMALDRAARHAAAAVLEGLAGSDVAPTDALWGAGYGVVHTAKDLGQDIGMTAAAAIEGAVEQADALGLSAHEAANAAARGALEAAREIGPGSAEELQGKLLDALIAANEGEPLP